MPANIRPTPIADDDSTADRPLKNREAFLISSAVIFSVTLLSIAGALVYVFFNRGFGVGDIWAYLYWTIPFACFVLFCAAMIARFVIEWSRKTMIFVSILLSVFLAIGWQVVVYLALGAWLHAFSFPLTPWWAFGAAVGQIIFYHRRTEIL